MYKQELGKLGEDYACKYLVENNYEIVERNFSAKQGEIDIIAWEEDVKELVFIEVKTRTNQKYGSPVDAVTRIKQKNIYKTSQYYVYIHNIYETFIRFDVIEVYVSHGKAHINHIKQIF